jgi:arylsulfatase A
MRSFISQLFAISALLVTALLAQAQAAASKPNIVFILADDLGWRDLACCGHEWHETPHLDRLAREGMRFTTAYAAAPICSASRASILTGKSPARLGFEFVTKFPTDKRPDTHALLSPPYTLDLPLAEVTLAEMLAPAGYHTGFFGKWHLSQHEGGYLGWSATHGPLQQGFAEGDADFGSHPYEYLKRDGRALGSHQEGEFPADSLTDKAISFLRENRDRRFFMQLSHYYVHDPIHTRVPWLMKKYEQRLPKGAKKDRAAYAAMVETLDHLVGRVLREIDDLGIANDTLIIFTSDNGGHPNFTANGPLRGSKWNLYEAGIRVPCIVRWPGVIKAGTSCAEPMVGFDWFPTLREIAGSPDDDLPRDGRSLLPLLRGEAAPPEPRALVWHFPYYHPETGFDAAPAEIGVNDFATSQTRPHSAIRVGSHKLIHFYEDGRNELYHLAKDEAEQLDLSQDEPARTAAMQLQLEAYLKATHARLPTVNEPREVK